MRMLSTLTLVLVVAAAPAFAEPSNALWIGPTTRALRTSSANALTKDSLTGGELGFARALPIGLPHGLDLAADGTFGWGGASGTMFQTMSTSIDTLTFMVGGRVRYPLHTRVVATARLGIGMSRAAVAISDDNAYTASDHGWGATSQASLALDLRLGVFSQFMMGLRVELGYVGAAPISMTARSPHDADTLQLMMQNASLGSLNLSGPVFAMSAVSEF